ncbi:MAG: type I-U CRISPR-associated protein Csb2 [Chloroflexi bacterium]|nr:type I-U CRISPR-associated protein Csb2 [Chloroflexota bacterium]
MIAIAFKFNANRYHATQWGRHVNEGVLEWPPSPWRILRCLVSTWRRTLPDTSLDEVFPILQALANELPSFRLPPAAAAHTRHYMPLFEGNAPKSAMVIDSFIAIQPEGELVAVWPDTELAPVQKATLASILGNLWYLGRAESWCEARLMESASGVEINSRPLENGVLPSGDVDAVRVLVPATGRPLHMIDLCVETGELRSGGRIDPPGAQWVLYTRPSDCFSPRYGSTSYGNRVSNVVRFAVSGAVRPLVTDAMQIAELARRSAMSQYGRANQDAASPTLSGKAASGAPLTDHQHAFYLPTDEDEDGKIDHLTVWAPRGFDDSELDALSSMRMLNPGGGRPPLQLVFQSCGVEDEYRKDVSIFREFSTWRSITPFVLNRHVKLRGPKDSKQFVDGPEDQLRKEIQRRNSITASLEHVEVKAPQHPIELKNARGFRPIEFYRWRRNGGGHGQGTYNFRIVFDAPVAGPIALGYACHFGLGLFVPDESKGEHNGYNNQASD